MKKTLSMALLLLVMLVPFSASAVYGNSILFQFNYSLGDGVVRTVQISPNAVINVPVGTTRVCLESASNGSTSNPLYFLRFSTNNNTMYPNSLTIPQGDFPYLIGSVGENSWGRGVEYQYEVPSSFDINIENGAASFTVSYTSGNPEQLVSGSFKITFVTNDDTSALPIPPFDAPSTPTTSNPTVEISESDSPPSGPTGQLAYIVGVKEFANVRSGPGTNHAIAGQAMLGEEVLLQRWDDEWVYALYNDATQIGWIHGKFIAVR